MGQKYGVYIALTLPPPLTQLLSTNAHVEYCDTFATLASG